ncbi:MAG: TetR/AcrR family transcriptional regulator [Stappiaceae bacterium]
MTDTRARILDVAAYLTQTRGFNGFSYIDLAEEIGVKTSSIHYHFKVKADLGLALVERTLEEHIVGFQNLDAGLQTPEQRLSAMVEFFQAYVEKDKFCLCGMLSAELSSVSRDVKRSLKAYFRTLRTWITTQFKEMGVSDPEDRALSFISALEGAVLLARLEDDPSVVAKAMKQIIKG